MTDDPSALIVIQSAELPQNFKIKAAKFLLRVIAGTFGHRALQAAQEGLDTIAGQTKVAMALADAVAKEAVQDPVQMERARARFSAQTHRKQENIEEVAKVAAEQIAIEPADPATEPEDDWLNVFTRYAEDASSDRARRLWGRVLAGEYRSPGSISLRTLRLLSELDQKTADDFERVVGFITQDFIYRPEAENQGEPISRLMRLETAGLVALGGGLLSRNLSPSDGLMLIVRGDPLSLAGEMTPGEALAVPCANVTAAGMELARMIRKQVTSHQALLRLAEFLKGGRFRKLVIGQVLVEGSMNNVQVIHEQ